MATRAKDRAADSRTRVKQAQPQLVAPGNAISLLTTDKLKQLYASMLKCRMVEERAATASRDGKSGAVRIGHEAIAVAITIDLQAEDSVAPSERDLVTDVMQGTPLKQILSRVTARITKRGKTKRNAKKTESINVITPASAVGTHLSIATGVAQAYKMLSRKNVVIALCGTDSNSIGEWHESLNFAGIHKLPIIYVVENAAIGTPQKPTRHGASYPFPIITVDGGDVVAVYRVASEGISRARNGGGPTLVECLVNDRAPKQSGEVEDPLAHMERYLRKRTLWSDQWKRDLMREFKGELSGSSNGSRAGARRKPESVPDRMFSFSIRDRELGDPK